MEYRFQDYTLETAPNYILRKAGTRLQCGTTQLRVLHKLLDRASSQGDRMVRTRTLLQSIWLDRLRKGSEEAVHQAVRRLREALGDTSADIVRTEGRAGYLIRSDIPVTRIAGPDTTVDTTEPITTKTSVNAQQNEPVHGEDLRVFSELADKYSTEDIRVALNAVFATKLNPPITIEGTPLDGYRRVVSHFWGRVFFIARKGGAFERLLKDYFGDAFFYVWKYLEPLERLKLREMYTRDGSEGVALEERIQGKMSTWRVRKLYERWKQVAMDSAPGT